MTRSSVIWPFQAGVRDVIEEREAARQCSKYGLAAKNLRQPAHQPQAPIIFLFQASVRQLLIDTLRLSAEEIRGLGSRRAVGGLKSNCGSVALRTTNVRVWVCLNMRRSKRPAGQISFLRFIERHPFQRAPSGGGGDRLQKPQPSYTNHKLTERTQVRKLGRRYHVIELEFENGFPGAGMFRFRSIIHTDSKHEKAFWFPEYNGTKGPVLFSSFVPLQVALPWQSLSNTSISASSAGPETSPTRAMGFHRCARRSAAFPGSERAARGGS